MRELLAFASSLDASRCLERSVADRERERGQSDYILCLSFDYSSLLPNYPPFFLSQSHFELIYYVKVRERRPNHVTHKRQMKNGLKKMGYVIAGINFNPFCAPGASLVN